MVEIMAQIKAITLDRYLIVITTNFSIHNSCGIASISGSQLPILKLQHSGGMPH